jgi:biopolymer transport protein ExbD
VNRTVVISIDGANQISINQEVTELRDLGPRLQDIFKTRIDRTIFINADENLFFNDVATVIDIAKGAGVDKIGLMTESITSASAQ